MDAVERQSRFVRFQAFKERKRVEAEAFAASGLTSSSFGKVNNSNKEN